MDDGFEVGKSVDAGEIELQSFVGPLWLCVCVSFPCSHDVKSIYSINLKKNGDHHWTQISTACRRLFFYVSNIYSVCTRQWSSPGKRSTFKKDYKVKEDECCSCDSSFIFISIIPSQCHKPRPHLNVLTTQKKSRAEIRSTQPTSVLQLLNIYSFSTFIKKRNREDRWRRRWWKWRRRRDKWLKQERKNTTDAPARPRPNMPSSIPSTGECNVKSECVCLCVCVCVCGGFEASVWRGWLAPSSPHPCRPQRLWAAGGRSPRTRSRRPGRCCWEDEDRRWIHQTAAQLQPQQSRPEASISSFFSRGKKVSLTPVTVKN